MSGSRRRGRVHVRSQLFEWRGSVGSVLYWHMVRSCQHPEEMQSDEEIQVFCLQSSAKIVNWGLIDPCSEGVWRTT